MLEGCWAGYRVEVLQTAGRGTRSAARAGLWVRRILLHALVYIPYMHVKVASALEDVHR